MKQQGGVCYPKISLALSLSLSCFGQNFKAKIQSSVGWQQQQQQLGSNTEMILQRLDLWELEQFFSVLTSKSWAQLTEWCRDNLLA